MTATREESNTIARYGPAGFAALAVNMLVLEALTWFFLLPAWYMLPVVVLPVVIVNAVVAVGLTKVRGVIGQIGRGMLIACASAPLTAVVFIVGFIVAKAIGPI